MKIAPAPENELQRLKALNEYFILDSAPEADFDDITFLASELCNAPIALVNIFDSGRHWVKSGFGLTISHTSPDNSFCLHSINSPDEVFIVADLTKDERFRDNPLVTGKPHAVFYAGVPLVNPEGYILGALCVMDSKSRTLNDGQINTLKALARQTVSLLELRKKTLQLKLKQDELNNSYADLEKIAHIASHDLKSPLNNIISLTHLLKDDYSKKLDEEGNEYITFLNDAAYQLSDLVSGIVSYTRSSQLSVDQKEQINVAGLIEEITGLLNIPGSVNIKYKKDSGSITASRLMLKQVLMQLLHNAIQYNTGKQVKIEVDFHGNKHAYVFEVKDNGPGIAEDDKDKIFNLFERLQNKIKDGESMGIGLAIVKRLVEKAGGEIKVDTELNKGSSFVFTIPK